MISVSIKIYLVCDAKSFRGNNNHTVTLLEYVELTSNPPKLMIQGF